MFPRKARITTLLFKQVQTSRNTVSGQHVTLRVLPYESTRCAIVVSKKVAPKAVDRNKIKRQIAHILKTLALPKALIVVMVKPSYVRAQQKEIKEMFESIVPKINV